MRIGVPHGIDAPMEVGGEMPRLQSRQFRAWLRILAFGCTYVFRGDEYDVFRSAENFC